MFDIPLKDFSISEFPNLDTIYILGQMIILKGGKAAKYMCRLFQGSLTDFYPMVPVAQ